MKQWILITLIFIFCGISACCQNLVFKPAFSVILDSAQGKKLFDQCSRSVPSVKDFWTPREQDIAILENNFKTVYALLSNDCCIGGARVDSLEHYGFQYIGVNINNRKFIYINAFPLEELDLFKRHNQDPEKIPIVVCDGGTSFWGVLFEIKTIEFSHLAFNGIA